VGPSGGAPLTVRWRRSRSRVSDSSRKHSMSAFETRRHIRQRFDLYCSRRNRGGCDKAVHGVAFLSWNQHPEPTSSRRATPLLLFQQSPGHARLRLSFAFFERLSGHFVGLRVALCNNFSYNRGTHKRRESTGPRSALAANSHMASWL
jgi:hypothetical protein